jgi:hypothetical protein
MVKSPKVQRKIHVPTNGIIFVYFKNVMLGLLRVNNEAQ